MIMTTSKSVSADVLSALAVLPNETSVSLNRKVYESRININLRAA